MKFVTPVPAFLVAFAIAPAAVAQEFAQPVINGGPAWASDYAAGGVNQQLSTFSFASTTDIQGIRVWGLYAGNPVTPSQDDFTVRFFEVTAGVPGTTPVQQFTGASILSRNPTAFLGANNETIYDVAIDLGFPLQFVGGQTYALSVINDTDGSGAWNWQSSNATGTTRLDRTGDYLSTAAWDPQAGSLAFELNTLPVPEPFAALTAAFLGCLAIGSVRGRRSLKN